MHRRLGYKLGGGGLQDIKAHPWFAGVDWDGIYRKEVAPPFEPDVSLPHRQEVRTLTVFHSRKRRISTRRTSWKNCCWRRIRSRRVSANRGRI